MLWYDLSHVHVYLNYTGCILWSTKREGFVHSICASVGYLASTFHKIN